MIAPAAIGKGIPSPAATPIADTPIVPAVVHAESVEIEIIAHRIGKAAKKMPGVNNFKP